MNDFPEINENDIKVSFDKISEVIFNKIYLKISNEYFRIVEIEYYFYSSIHPDTKTLPRQTTKCDLWEHKYGFDICFDSDNNSYGGILIRSIKDIKNNNFFNNPKKVYYHLLNICKNYNLKFNDIEICFHNIDYKYNENEPIKTNRIIKKTKDYDFFDKPYRHIIELTKENKIKKKENVAINIVEKDARFNFLGYDLKIF